MLVCKRIIAKNPIRENRTQGFVGGAPSDGRSYPDNILSEVPSPPSMSEWTFLEQFKKHHRTVKRESFQVHPGDVIDLKKGIDLDKLSKDNYLILETAYHDFSRFLADLQIPENCGYKFNFEFDNTLPQETFVIDVKKRGGSIKIADIEAGRRAIYFLMDEIISCGGCLILNNYRREPFVKIRISRCYYGPKKRPPLSIDELKMKPNYKDILANDSEYRDELIDGCDYFPDAYLSRLARDGVNGLWLVGYFNEICKSNIIPEYGEDSGTRLKKLREIVAKCARYGIKIYIFCLEPCGLGLRIPMRIANKHPDIIGHRSNDFCYFCISSKKGRDYLEESCFYLFSQVPNLGGLINLCVGERPTHCYSGFINLGFDINCPRCSKRKPEEVLSEVLTIMQRGMNKANPKAKLIAWPYSQYIVWGERKTVEAVDYIPDNVILIHNFESRGRAKQLNKERVMDDYWLAYSGPSQLFKDCAQAAIKNNIKFGAKIQTACSYELATVPFVPVPGILYKKYKAMRKLQVSTVMQSWFIGSCPSVMTQAAGMLSCEPFLKTEKEFLLKLAAINWGDSAKDVALAWKLFQKGYENYPRSRVFSYYSPMNAGVVWPLFLKPRDKELYPPFRANCPPCGDRIGECLKDDFTLEEAIILCGKMTFYWNKGLQILNGIAGRFDNNEDRQKDIGVANAVGIQIRSAYNILRFYQLREEMAWTSLFEKKKLLLKKLRKIVSEEIRNTKRLNEFARRDSRLGFHADSECHIYFPAKLEWRLKQLKQLLAEEFPQVEAQIDDNEEPFPEYIGKYPGKYFSDSKLVGEVPVINDSLWKNIPCKKCEQEFFSITEKPELLIGRSVEWQSCYTKNALYVMVHCNEPDISSVKETWELPDYTKTDCVELLIEKQRLWPSQKFVASAGGDFLHVFIETQKESFGSVEAFRGEGYWRVLFHIPWLLLGFEQVPGKPIRVNLKRIIPNREDSGYAALTWGGNHPLMERLLLPPDNPADLGWLKLS